MIDHLQQMNEEIINQAPKLALAVTEIQNSRYPALIPLDSQILPMRERLFCVYAEALTMDEKERHTLLKEWGEEVGTLLSAERSISLDMMLSEVPDYRTSIGKVMRHEALELGLSAVEMYDVIEILDTSINAAVYFFSVPFINSEKERHKTIQSLVSELSVPIVSITDYTAVLPLIGSFDYDRAFTFQEVTLSQASKLELNHLIIDLSGLQTTDTYVAQELYHLFDALTLLGIQPIVSGVTPPVAQTLVQLGLTFGKVKSFATLKQALAYLK